MATGSASDHLHSMDDVYFSALLDGKMVGNDDLLADAKHAEGLRFQEALMGSLNISLVMKSKDPSSSLSEGVTMPVPNTEMIAMEAVATGGDGGSGSGSGESSQILCEICVERKENDQMFRSSSCVHSYCSDCIGKHVLTKLHDNNSTVACPGLDCKTVLELEACRPMLPKAVIDLWEETLCRAMIDEFQTVYCPFRDCSAMMINDAECEEKSQIIKEAECPFCHRLFCARCCVPWHAGVECEEYQKLNEDERGREDLMVLQLARDNKWGRCPRCRFYVERTEGCPHMICRCQIQFCYGCGEEWNENHGGCSRD